MKKFALFLAGLMALMAPHPAFSNDESLKLEDISFLVGHWKGEGGELAPEEIWFDPAAGVLPGFFRWPFEDGPYVLETLAFVEDEKGVKFYFKHFDPKIMAWEKEHANTYRLEKVTGKCLFLKLVSESPDVPAGIRYCLKSADTLEFTGIEEGGNFEEAEFRLTFERVKE